MLKNDLIKAVAKDTKASPDTVRAILESAGNAIINSVRSGNEAFVLGLGKIVISRRGNKVARNIWTKETVIVPPRNVPVFRPSVALTKAAQDYKGE